MEGYREVYKGWVGGAKELSTTFITKKVGIPKQRRRWYCKGKGSSNHLAVEFPCSSIESILSPLIHPCSAKWKIRDIIGLWLSMDSMEYERNDGAIRAKYKNLERWVLPLMKSHKRVISIGSSRLPLQNPTLRLLFWLCVTSISRPTHLVKMRKTSTRS